MLINKKVNIKEKKTGENKKANRIRTNPKLEKSGSRD